MDWEQIVRSLVEAAEARERDAKRHAEAAEAATIAATAYRNAAEVATHELRAATSAEQPTWMSELIDGHGHGHAVAAGQQFPTLLTLGTGLSEGAGRTASGETQRRKGKEAGRSVTAAVREFVESDEFSGDKGMPAQEVANRITWDGVAVPDEGPLNATRAALSRLLNQGVIERPARGVYRRINKDSPRVAYAGVATEVAADEASKRGDNESEDSDERTAAPMG